MLQERIPQDRHYPWRVVVCCVLLIRSNRNLVRSMFEEFFRVFKAPRLLIARQERLGPMLQPLGLQARRALILLRLTSEYLEGRPLAHCFGVGQYAQDALDIFVHGHLDVRPADRFLRLYLTWRKTHGHHIKIHGS